MTQEKTTKMKATEIGSMATLLLLFEIALPAPCLAGQQSIGQRQHQDAQSRQKSEEPQQLPAQQARPSTRAKELPQQFRQRHQEPSADGQREREKRDQDAQRPLRSQSRPRQDQRETRDNYPERDRHDRADHDRHDQRQMQMPQHFQHGAWQERRAHNWQLEHRTWQQRGGYRGYRIPGDRFSRYFGPRHGFRIYELPLLVVGGYPRFQYGGYWFRPIDPWPEYWPDDWYETDDVYIAYSSDGYYLFNSQYPSVGIAVEILL